MRHFLLQNLHLQLAPLFLFNSSLKLRPHWLMLSIVFNLCIHSSSFWSSRLWLPGSTLTMITASISSATQNPPGQQLWANFGPTLDQLWTIFGPTLDQILSKFGPTLHQPWTNLGPTLDQIWTNFAPTFDQLLTIFGPSLEQLWTNFGPTLDHLWTNFGPTLDLL